MLDAPQDSKNFLTWTALGTFTGASLAVALLANTTRKLSGWNSAWPAFIWALIISAVASYQLQAFTDALSGSVLVLVNACLLFWSALGMQETALQAKPVPGGTKPQAKKDINFWSSWFDRS